jgi:hypothetical protein
MTEDLKLYGTQMLSLYDGSSDICMGCRDAVDGECFRKNGSWHAMCLSCTRCHGPAAFVRDTLADHVDVLPACRFCGYHRREAHVTMLSQRRQLLWVGLAQLMEGLQLNWYALRGAIVKIPGDDFALSFDQTDRSVIN